jgi:ABC-2 type transport system ATP-binding protein
VAEGGLELRGVEKHFPGFRLGPISIRLGPGVAYGLLGPNGAGKTTLLNLLTLQLKLTLGEMRYDGAPIVWGDTTWKRRWSYIRETPSFYDELTVAETLRLAARLYGRWDEQFAQELLGRLQLEASKKVGALSKGSKVKLGIVAALAQHAELLILDEPTSGLDPTARAELQGLLRELLRMRPGLCLVLSSHIFDDIEQVAEEVLILRNGKLVFQEALLGIAQAVLLRLPSTAGIERSPDIRLVWRKDGYNWVVVRRGGQAEEELLSIPGCSEETAGPTLSVIYHGTETCVQ